jgi:integrase/recombinase XerD
MQSPVKLYLRVRFPDGSHPFLKAAFASNGRVRPGYAMYAGKAISFPSCSYYLRYQSNGKRAAMSTVWPAGATYSLCR